MVPVPYIVYRAIQRKLARQAKTIQIRYVGARSLFLKTEKISCFKKKCLDACGQGLI